MSDCLQTLHTIINSKDESARAMSDLVRAWPSAVAAQKETRGGAAIEAVEPFRATGEAVRRVSCPVARRVILITEQNLSEK